MPEVDPVPEPIIVNPDGLDPDAADVDVDEVLDEATGLLTKTYRHLSPGEIQSQQDAETIAAFLDSDHGGDPVAGALAAFMRRTMT